MEIELPETARALVDLIGLNATIDFVTDFGGIKIYMPNKYAKQQAMFADSIGEVKAERLCQQYAGQYFSIPRCLKLLNLKRDEAIRTDYDSGNFTRNELVLKYRLGHQRIDQILKKPSQADVIEQADLFAA